jgi:hypothetical protein
VKTPYHTPFLPANGAGRCVERAVLCALAIIAALSVLGIGRDLAALAVSVGHDVIVAKQSPPIDHKRAAGL